MIHYSRSAGLEYLTHLDMIRLWQRALRRTGLPLVYTQGFNPHEKFSLAIPLSVGMTSTAEYLEVILAKLLKPEDIRSKLQEALPAPIKIQEVRLSPYKQALTPQVALLEYQISWPGALGNIAQLQKKIAGFLAEKEHKFLKKGKKLTKEIDIRGKVQALELQEKDGEHMILMQLKVDQQGSVKPEEVMQVLGGEPGPLKVHRQATYFRSPQGEYYLP